ncbi:response regulator [Candidatus Obscuribacterales bacterium]|nr:response regulator [Candidatus Obscuribacterales bacterium]
MKIATRITIGFFISVVCIICLAYFAHGNIEGINNSRKWVSHTVEVILERDTLESSLKDYESRIRGYVASGDELFLQGADELKAKVERCFNRLKSLTSDNPAQQQNLNELSPLMSERLQQLEAMRQARKTSGFSESLKLLRTPENGYTFRWVSVLNRIRAEEENLLKRRTEETVESIRGTETLLVVLSFGSMLAIGLTGTVIVRGFEKNVSGLIQGTDKVAAGDLDFRCPVTSKDELSQLARSFNIMIERLRTLSESQAAQDWHRSGLNKFAVILQGQRSLKTASEIFLSELVPMLGAHHGAMYVFGDETNYESLQLAAAYGGDASELPQSFKLGDGLIGQCAIDKRRLNLHDVRSDAFVIKTATARSQPFEVMIVPLLFEGEVKGVFEVAALREFSQKHVDFIDELSAWIAAVFNSINVSNRVDLLLQESQVLNEELQAQQEELECQQDELRTANEELEEKADALDIQNQEILDKNIELEQMQVSVEAKAHELAQASKYKSEFLANMSHDLRTPLNSLLIFSELLGENEDNNLLDFQVDYAKNIHSAGKTLLSLIDDVLDLSKIESGTVVLNMTDVDIQDLVDEMERTFGKTAQAKGLQFEIRVSPDVPKSIRSDSKRLSQLLTNLLTNSFKFTEKGSVKLDIDVVSGGAGGDRPCLRFEVVDTGIGISRDKQELVFEAFRQADSTIKGKYGGTGLGLAICRQLSELLGGYIDLRSEAGEGCTFTIVLPLVYEGRRDRTAFPSGDTGAKPSMASVRELEKTIESTRDTRILSSSSTISDDRRDIGPEDRVLLVIEDDEAFARMLLDLARKHSFRGVVALNGRDGIELARRIVPDGITLDLNLPDMQGWTVLDQLKQYPDTRHIPVHIISVDVEGQRSLESGAVGFAAKPVSVSGVKDALDRIKNFMVKESGSVLLVAHDTGLRSKLADLIGDSNISVSAVGTGEEALAIMSRNAFDCVVVHIDLQDEKGTDLIGQIQKIYSDKPPVLVYADRALTGEEAETIDRLRTTSTVKDVDSPERLLSEVLLFLHRVEASLPEGKRRMIDSVRQTDHPLAGRKVLIVDDDPRNIAAMKGALHRQNMNLLYAENGKEAIDRLQRNPDVELVLMDMMMPEMDGYEAMQVIRRDERFSKLPIIAVTAKAMKEDRRKCLEAGASDYISKPVDKSQLLSLLRVWLYKR